MKDGPVIAAVAALLGDPARASMLTALMDGRALTASELAGEAGVGLPTASGHLSKLEAGGLVSVEKQGRHRYFRLSGSAVSMLARAGSPSRAATAAMTGPSFMVRSSPNH